MVLNWTDKWNIIQMNLSFGTPLSKGHFHSGDTKFGPDKYSRNIFINYLCWNDTSIWEKGENFPEAFPEEYLDLYLEITHLHTTLFSQKSALLRCVTNAFKISSFCYIRVCFSLIFLLIWRICFHSGPLPMIFVTTTFFH